MKPLACKFCREPLTQTSNNPPQVCARPGCQRAQKLVESTIEWQRKEVREIACCPICKVQKDPKKPFCPKHEFVTVPCRRCLRGKVVRRYGPGRPDTLCPKCLALPRRKRSFYGSVADA